MSSIEAQPLDLTEEQAEFLLEFCYAIEREIRSSTSLAIAMAVARETVLHGDCRTTHREFGRRTGACRRSIDNAVKQLKRYDLITRIGTTDSGTAIYRANFAADCVSHGLA